MRGVENGRKGQKKIVGGEEIGAREGPVGQREIVNNGF
jgi:hypothetical protein